MYPTQSTTNSVSSAGPLEYPAVFRHFCHHPPFCFTEKRIAVGESLNFQHPPNIGISPTPSFSEVEMSPFKPKVNPFTIICFCSLSSFTYASPSWVFIFFFSPILWSQHINLITRETFFQNTILSFFSHPTPLLCPALCPALLCSLSRALKKKIQFYFKNPIFIPHPSGYYTLFLAFNPASWEWSTLSNSASLPPIYSLDLVPSNLSPKPLLKILPPKSHITSKLLNSLGNFRLVGPSDVTWHC